MNENTTQSNNETIVMSQDSTVINTSYPGKPLTPDDMEISVPGCEIISKIGSGGMGHVFLARQRDGRTEFIDPQNGDGNFDLWGMAESIHYLRIDTLRPREMAMFIEKAGG